MVEIAHRIRQKMSADQATLTEITECVGLLLALKESPVPLWKQYLHLSMRYLQKTKTKALEDIDTLPLYAHPSPSAQQQEQQPTPKTTPKKTLRKSSKSSGTSKEPKAFPKPLRTQSSASLLSLPAADKISYLNVNYLKHVEGFVVSFQNYFLAPISLGTNSNNISTSSTATTAVTVAASEQEKEEKKEITHVTEQQRQHPAWITKDSSVHANLTSDQREEASEAVKTAISETISQYLDIINSFLDFPEDISSIRSEVHIHVLQNLYSASLSSNGLCNMIGFDTLASGLIQDWETKLIRQALGKIKDELMTRISIQDLTGRVRSQQQENLLDTPSGDLSSTVKNITSTSPTITAATTTTTATKNTSLASVLKETTQWLHDVFKNDTIPFLENCMSSDAQFLETKEGRASFLKNFQDSFKESFWEQVLKEMQQKSLSLTSPATTSIPIPSSLPVSTSASPSTAASTSRNKDSLLPLVMSHLCFQFSNGFVEQLYKVLSKTLFRPGKRSRPDSFLIESFEQPLVVIPQLARDCKAVAQSCQETGHVLLDGFVARTGNELSWLVMDMDMKMDMQHSFLMDGDGGGTIGDTATSQTPASVSETWERVYRYLNDIEHQVMMVYGDEGDDRLGNHEISSESIRRESGFKSLGGRGGHGYGHGGGGGDGSGSNNDNSGRLSNRNESLTSFGSNTMNTMNNNNTRLFENQQRNLLLSHIDKLFSDRVDIFVRCQDLNRTGIMFGIVKILLKAWAESVRLRTYGRRSFQQIQVDAEFAKVWLWRFATADERLMYSLLEETQQTAYRRCFDPIPLDMN
ncbi:Vacuolar protein sorting-associated protein 51, partial [Lobosporangium transversale]